MCGIAGYWDFFARDPQESLRDRISIMTSAMLHRGPDSGGVWMNPAKGLAFGHRRLAIRDVSHAGHQPMSTPSGGAVLCYNGEVYNADELRDDLVRFHGVNFIGGSDTEVILHGCATWGVDVLVRRLIGMFAFSFWDGESRTLTLVRDRMGIKPLYWSLHDGAFSFASELKAIKAGRIYGGSGSGFSVDRSSLALMMRHGYITAPHSIYEGVHKLPGGHLLRLTRDGGPVIARFWDPRKEFRDGARNPFKGGIDAAVAELEALLRDSVKRRMVADVPLGAFLSGGIDSSLVAALMQTQSSRPIKTFAIGFHEQEFNEAPHARAVADHLGTEHVERYVSADEAMDIIPRIPDYYDEPFADASQLPTYLLSRMTREHVTVSLSGDGGDELFAGYVHYNHEMARMLNWPGWKRRLFRRGVRAFPPSWWDFAVKFAPRSVIPDSWRNNFSDRLFRRVDAMNEDFIENVRNLVSIWRSPLDLVPGARDLPGAFGELSILDDSPGNVETMQYLDSVTYLVDDILVKVDRASMAVSLEVRVPLIDHRVYSFAWRLPMSMKVRENKSKWILRRILYKYVPSELIDRPKMGFSVPIYAWLRGPLREWAEGLLSPERLAREGWLAPELVGDAWRRLQDGEAIERQLWNVLMFQAWLDNERKKPGCVSADMEIEIRNE